jgi:hypothetical protein
MKQHSTAQRLLHEAKALSGDVARQCMISATIAEMFDKMVSISIALTWDDPTRPLLIWSDLIWSDLIWSGWSDLPSSHCL